MSGIAIKVEHLTKTYRLYNRNRDRIKEAINPFGTRYSRDFYALNDVSFEIRKGDVVGIIGENGAGKSTLLKILTGVLTQSNGNVSIVGKVASLLELGAGFNPELTGIENIYFNGTIMGFSKEEMDTKLADIVSFADIGDFIDQPVKMYSSGMFARLAFALNSNIDPEILIVDEALSVGDVFFQNKCFRKFEDLKNKGTTIVFVSHDSGSVKQLCSKAIWLEHGVIKQQGDVTEVCDAYFKKQITSNNKSVLDYDDITNVGTDNTCSASEGNIDVIRAPSIQYKKDDIRSPLVDIKSVFVKKETGEVTNVLKTEESFELHVVLEFHETIDNAICGVTFSNNKGIEVIGINTFMTLHGKTFKGEKDKIIEVKFSFTLPKIHSGKYLLNPAVARGIQTKHEMLTWMNGAAAVDIDNSSNYDIGIIEIESSVDLKRYTKGIFIGNE